MKDGLRYGQARPAEHRRGGLVCRTLNRHTFHERLRQLQGAPDDGPNRQLHAAGEDRGREQPPVSARGADGVGEEQMGATPRGQPSVLARRLRRVAT